MRYLFLLQEIPAMSFRLARTTVLITQLLGTLAGCSHEPPSSSIVQPVPARPNYVRVAYDRLEIDQHIHFAVS